MSGSETGVTVGLQKSPVPSQPIIQNMCLSFSADGRAVYKPITAASTYQPSAATTGGEGSGGGGSAVPYGLNMNTIGESEKRKRGRPRKYGQDGNMALALTTPLPSGATPPSGRPASPNSLKKARGRPPGSISRKKNQMEALGSAGVGFTPHIITVKAGEDVSSKIMSFSQHGPRAVCILSANGTISNVTLRQPATSGGTVTYEGRFEILSLSGSYLLSENDGQPSRSGGLSVSLSGSNGRVLGGSVAGLLTAASPVQVILGSFIADGRKESKSAIQMEPLSAPPKLAPGGVTTVTSSPPSRATLSKSSGGPGSSPVNLGNNSNLQGMSSAPPKLAPGGVTTGTISPPSRGTLSKSSGGPGSSPVNLSNNSNLQGMSGLPWK